MSSGKACPAQADTAARSHPITLARPGGSRGGCGRGTHVGHPKLGGPRPESVPSQPGVTHLAGRGVGGGEPSHNVKIIVDDTMWVDFVQDGFPRNHVVWYYKVDTDPDVEARAPLGWRSYQYVVSTQSDEDVPRGIPTVDKALTNSVPVAVFGSGSDDVVVRRIAPQGLRKPRRVTGTRHVEPGCRRAEVGRQPCSDAQRNG